MWEWKSIAGRGHSKDKGPEMRMSLAVSRTVRKPLCPELHGPKGMVASSQTWKQCSFPSGDTGSQERVLFNL